MAFTFLPLRVERLDDTQDNCIVKRASHPSFEPLHPDASVDRCHDDVHTVVIHVDQADMAAAGGASRSAHPVETHGNHGTDH
jgi:hypothetical protein